MKRIFLLSQTFTENVGSYSGFFEQTAKHFHTKGYKAIIIAGRKKGQPKYEKLKYAEVHRLFQLSIPFMKTFANTLVFAVQLRSLLKKLKAGSQDIYLANSLTALGLYDRKYFVRAGDQPQMVYLRNMEIAKKYVSLLTRIARAIHIGSLYFLERIYIKNAFGIIYSSQETRGLFIKYYGGKKKPYFIPHSGVDIKELRKGKRLDYPGRNMLFVGSESERIRKGVMYLEEALPAVFKKHPDLNLLHVGGHIDWKLPDWCKKRIVSAGRVSWDKMGDYYATADLLVVTSIHEMFPNVVMEALAVNVPVVIGDIQGVREYIIHKRTGYIHKRGNKKGVISGIKWILRTKTKSFSIRGNIDLLTYNEILFEFTVTNKKFNLLKKLGV